MTCSHSNSLPSRYNGRFGCARCLRHELQLRHSELSLLEIAVSRNTIIPYYESRGQIRRWLFTREYDKLKKYAPLFWHIHADLFENQQVVNCQPPTMQPTREQLQQERQAALHSRLSFATSTLLGKRPRIWNPSPYRHDVRTSPSRETSDSTRTSGSVSTSESPRKSAKRI